MGEGRLRKRKPSAERQWEYITRRIGKYPNRKVADLSLVNHPKNVVKVTNRQYRSQHTRTGWKLLIKPSKESVQKLRGMLRKTWLSLKGQNVSAVVGRLNPIIRGWANYYRISVDHRIFSKLDNWVFCREMRYVNHTHPKKSGHWKKARYWGKLIPDRKDNWVFGDKKKGIYLLKFIWFTIERHVLVKRRASPDDPNLREYWQKRNAIKARELMPSRKRIVRRQMG